MIRYISRGYLIFNIIAVFALFFVSALPLYHASANSLLNTNTTQSQAASSNTNTSGTGMDLNPFKGGTLCDFLVTLLDIITEIAAIVGVLVLIGIGFYYILAQGNKEKLATAHRALLVSIIAITLLLGASVFAHILITTVNAVLAAGGGGFANQSALTCSP